MTSEDTQVFLNQILKKSQTPSPYNLSLEELKRLASTFQEPDLRPKAYVVLSAICQGARSSKGKDTNGATQLLTEIFVPVVTWLFGETDYTSLTTGAIFLTALFQVDSQLATVIFVRDGLIESVTDSVEISPTPALSTEIAHLLGQACGHKLCRAVITPQIVRWLDFQSQQISHLPLQSASSLALIKLLKGASSDPPDNGSPEVPTEKKAVLATIMTELIISNKSDCSVDAVEGLAYLSIDPVLKERLAQDPVFLKKLFALVPLKKSATQKGDSNTVLVYGIVAIICNLTSFRPRLNEEQQQVEKMKKMTKAGFQETDVTFLLDDDEHVKKRISALLLAGVLPVYYSAISLSDSVGIRQNVARSLLCVVEEKENRGKVLQAGGARVLQIIIKQALNSSPSSSKGSTPSLSLQDLDALQALAKLSITSSPVQVFGPNVGAIYDAIRPFSILFQHPSSNLLQRFEALMTLTNLASHSPEVASRIAKADGLIDRVELFLLEDHVLMQRASAELLCNLISGSDDAFERYSMESSSAASKLHILVALSDVDDMPTRTAASGALATLSSAPNVCRMLVNLQFEKHRFLPIMTQLLDPTSVADPDEGITETNPGLVHRAAVCVSNVLSNTKEKHHREKLIEEAKDCGLTKALIRVAKGEGVAKEAPILHQAAQGLKALVE